jgi:hypothetical protein
MKKNFSLSKKVISMVLSASMILSVLSVSAEPGPTEETITKLIIQKVPDKMVYLVGETFDTTGMEIVGQLEQGGTVPVTGYTISKTTSLEKVDETNGILISYQNKKEILFPIVRELKDITRTVYPNETTAVANTKAWGPPKVNNVWVSDGSLEEKAIDGTSFWINFPYNVYNLIDPSLSVGDRKLQPQYVTFGGDLNGKNLRKWDIGFDLGKDYLVKKLDMVKVASEYPTFEIWYSTAQIMPGTNFEDGWQKATNAGYVGDTTMMEFDLVKARHIRFHATSTDQNTSWAGFLTKLNIYAAEFGEYVPDQVERSALLDLIYEAEGKNKVLYTDATYANLVQKITEAKDALKLKTQEEIDSAKGALQLAINSLENELPYVSLEITTPPTKNVYEEKEIFDTTGMVVTAHFSDGIASKDKIITDYTVSDTPLTVGQTSISIEYSGKTVEQPITVTIIDLVTKLNITKLPTKMVYVEGETFDTAGMEIVADFVSGKKATLNEGDYVLSKTTPLLESDQTTGITIKYKNKMEILFPLVRKVVELSAITFPNSSSASRIKVWGPPKEGDVWATDGRLEEKSSPTGNFWTSASTFYGVFSSLQPAFVTTGGKELRKWDIGFDFGYEYVLDKFQPGIKKEHYPTFEIWYSNAQTMPGTNFEDGWTKATNAMYASTSTIITFDTIRARHIRFHPTSTTQTIAWAGTWNSAKFFGYQSTQYLPDSTDRSALLDAIMVAEEIVKSDYTPESVVDFTEKFLLAKTILPSKNQAEIDNAASNLFNAIDALEVTLPLVSISVTTPPTKTIYKKGETFDATGMVVTGHYSNGVIDKDKVITDYTFPTDRLSEVQTSVTVSVGEITTTQSITVGPKGIISIAVKNPPTKINYIEGQSFDMTGMVVEATYTDDSTGIITGFTVTSNPLVLGQTSKTITYDEKTTTQAITVVAKSIESISVKTAPTKTTYIEGNVFDPTGMVVNVAYDNGTNIDISTGFIVPPTALTVGQPSVTITYGGKSTTQAIIVNQKTLLSIAITTQPTTKALAKDTTFTVDGIITLTYDNGTTPTMNIIPAMCTGYDMSTMGDQTVTVTYGNKTATYSLKIMLAKLASETYTIGEEYVSGVGVGKTVAQVKAGFSAESAVYVKIYSATGTLLTDTQKVGTGCVVKLEVDGTTVEEVTVVITGDVKGDGEINSDDILLILNMMLKGVNLTDEYLMAANTKNDTDINSDDILLILNFMLKGIAFPTQNG